MVAARRVCAPYACSRALGRPGLSVGYRRRFAARMDQHNAQRVPRSDANPRPLDVHAKAPGGVSDVVMHGARRGGGDPPTSSSPRWRTQRATSLQAASARPQPARGASACTLQASPSDTLTAYSGRALALCDARVGQDWARHLTTACQRQTWSPQEDCGLGTTAGARGVPWP